MSTTEPRHVIFVCWGNICRSPMAERVAEKLAAERGLDDLVFTSAATSREELGSPMDDRAVAVLRRHGYRTGGHVAHQITRQEIEDAELVLAMENIHLDKMRAIAPDADNVQLLTDFDPDTDPGEGIPDPWYGPAAGFERTLASVEAAIPGLLDELEA